VRQSGSAATVVKMLVAFFFFVFVVAASKADRRVRPSFCWTLMVVFFVSVSYLSLRVTE
jgi:hypothetical protein